MNIDGKLYTLVYRDINALESRPIEIKPFFHFYPGSSALTFSTWSCNFTCPWCQNFHLSRKPLRGDFTFDGVYME
jgi:pyruvate formate lyase activating enzyme